MQQKEFKLPTMGDAFEHTCDQCGHLSICLIFHAFAPLMREKYEDDAPIDPIHLGKICTKFVDANTLKALEEGM